MTHRQVLDEVFAAWSAADAIRSSAFFAIDAIYREARHDDVVGRDAITKHFTRFFRDGPPFRFVAHDCIVDGDLAAVTYDFTVGSRLGGWQERPGCAIVRFAKDGTIVRWREYTG